MHRKVRGSITVESAFIMPLVLWLQVIFLFGMGLACSRCMASHAAVRACVRACQAGSVRDGETRMEEEARKALAGIPMEARVEASGRMETGVLSESARMEITVRTGIQIPWSRAGSMQTVSAKARRSKPAETIRRIRRTARSLRSLSELLSGDGTGNGE